MKKTLILFIAAISGIGSAMAQNIMVDVPSGYKVVVVPSSVTVSQAVAVPQTVYVETAPVAAPVAAPAPVAAYHPRARHIASVGEGMIIEHQITK